MFFLMLGSALLRSVCHMFWSFYVLTKLHSVTNQNTVTEMFLCVNQTTQCH